MISKSLSWGENGQFSLSWLMLIGCNRAFYPPCKGEAFSLPFPSPSLEVGLLHPARGSGECCKLPYRGLKTHILAILSLENASDGNKTITQRIWLLSEGRIIPPSSFMRQSASFPLLRRRPWAVIQDNSVFRCIFGCSQNVHSHW